MKGKGVERILLEFDGDFYGTVCLHWLKHVRKADVLTYTPLLGGSTISPEEVGETAMAFGIESAYFGNLERKFYDNILVHAMRCGIRDRNGSFLINALSRPVIAKEMVAIAEENNCSAVAFSALPQSLDQIRYVNLFSMLAPGLRVISPQTEWKLHTYADLLKYAKEHRLPVKETRRKEYIIETNMWGSRIKCGRIEDLWKKAPDELYHEIPAVQNLPDKARNVEIEFKEGLPVKVNGEEKDGPAVIAALRELGLQHGIGKRDIIGEELLGIKMRIIQEAPAAQILFTAHRALEDITLSKETLAIQDMLCRELVEIVYQGTWFSQLREAICNFFATTQRNVSGVIRLRLYKGNCSVTQRKAERPLYKQDLVTQERESTFPAADVDRFLHVWAASRTAQREEASSDSL